MAGTETRPIGLDWGAVMAVATARGVDLLMLAEVLPRLEAAIIAPRGEPDEDSGGEE